MKKTFLIISLLLALFICSCTNIKGPADDVLNQERIYENLTVSGTETYVKEAVKHTISSWELTKNPEFCKNYSSKEDIVAEFQNISQGDYTSPKAAYRLTLKDGAVENYLEVLSQFSDTDYNDLDVSKFQLSTLAMNYNGAYGAAILSACAVSGIDAGYIPTEELTENFAVILEYDNGFSSFTSFEKSEKGVDSTMCFLYNGSDGNIIENFRNSLNTTVGEANYTLESIQ
ncbi:MAG: hypothetical protein IJO74_02680 [Clostridia bacterium]|nr:hypothetical protein [Clostridia bacterium]